MEEMLVLTVVAVGDNYLRWSGVCAEMRTMLIVMGMDALQWWLMKLVHGNCRMQ